MVRLEVCVLAFYEVAPTLGALSQVSGVYLLGEVPSLDLHCSGSIMRKPESRALTPSWNTKGAFRAPLARLSLSGCPQPGRTLEDIQALEARFPSTTSPPSGPARVLLHRDNNNSSCPREGKGGSPQKKEAIHQLESLSCLP